MSASNPGSTTSTPLLGPVISVPPPALSLSKKPTEDKSSLITNIKNSLLLFIDGAVLKLVPEIGHLAPVILTFGAMFISIVTLNYPLGMLSLSTFEASALKSIISMVSGYITIPTDLSESKSAEESKPCQSSFTKMSPSRFEMFIGKGLSNEFPISSLYYITFVACYCIQSLYFFSNECSELGPNYSSRPYLAILGAGMFITLYSLYLISYGCNSLVTILFTILVGFLIGYLICYQNYFLFGKTSVDLIFVPPLTQRSGMDYICVTTSSSTQ